MQVFHNKSKVIITCNKRLSPYLQQEVKDLGYTIVRDFPTGVELDITLTECIKLNLNLRCASQILYCLTSFRANNPEELYRELADIAWEELIDFSGYFSVTSNVDNPTITTPLFANLKVKDAIVDRIKDKKACAPTPAPMPIKLSSTCIGKTAKRISSSIPAGKPWPNMATAKSPVKRQCWKPWPPPPS